MPTSYWECGSTCAAHWYQPTHGKLTCSGGLLLSMLFLGVFKKNIGLELYIYSLGLMLAHLGSHPVTLPKSCCEGHRHLS